MAGQPTHLPANQYCYPVGGGGWKREINFLAGLLGGWDIHSHPKAAAAAAAAGWDGMSDWEQQW